MILIKPISEKSGMLTDSFAMEKVMSFHRVLNYNTTNQVLFKLYNKYKI
jgi:hypothetical protein